MILPKGSDDNPSGPDKPSYPKPKDELELNGYIAHHIAAYFDDVKRSTSQLLRAIIFLWFVFVIPLLVLVWIVARANFEWKWLVWLGVLGTIATGQIDRYRTRRARKQKRLAKTTDQTDASGAEHSLELDLTDTPPGD